MLSLRYTRNNHKFCFKGGPGGLGGSFSNYQFVCVLAAKRRRPQTVLDTSSVPIICPICADSLRNPVVLVRCCSGIVCKACLSRNFEVNNKKCPLCAATIQNWFYHAEQRGELCPEDMQARIATAVNLALHAPPGMSSSDEHIYRAIAATGELRAEYESLICAQREAMEREELSQVMLIRL